MSDVATVDRLQFALAAFFHYLFLILTMGLGLFIALLKTVAHRAARIAAYGLSARPTSNAPAMTRRRGSWRCLLIGRGLALELRRQLDNPLWRTACDTVFCLKSAALAFRVRRGTRKRRARRPAARGWLFPIGRYSTWRSR
jgi:hypothetical protein